MSLWLVALILVGSLFVLAVYLIFDAYQKYRVQRSKLAHIPGISQFIPPMFLKIPLLNWFYKNDPRLLPIQYVFTKQNELGVKEFGNIFKLVIGTRGFVFVNDIETAKQVAVKGSKLFAKSEELSTPVLELFGNNIFTAWEESDWKRYRNLVHHAFSDTALETVVPATVNAMHNLIRLIDEKPENRLFIEDTSLLTIDVIGDAGFSYPFEAWKLNQNNFKLEKSTSADRTLSEHTSNFLKYGNIQGILPFSFLRKHLRIGPLKLFHEAVDAFKHTIEALIESRKKTIAQEDINRKDILSLILTAAQNNDSNSASDKPLSNMEVISNLFIFLLAGHETTARTLVFALFLLCTNPEVQKKAHQHVDSILENGRDPTYADFDSLTYIQNIIRETLRLYPVAVGILRELKQDYQVKGLNLPKGSLMMLLWNEYTRSKELFEKPNDFIPERFEDEANQHLIPLRSPSFGVGNRSCIGKKFAMIEATLALAMLLQKYNMKLSDPNYKMSCKVLVTLQPEEEPRITFKQRKF